VFLQEDIPALSRPLLLTTIAMSALLVASLLASCATDGFEEDPAREKAHKLTEKAYNEAYSQSGAGPDWDRVIKIATKAIEADPSFPPPYAIRGAAYNAKGRYRFAVNDLDRSLELSPDHAPAFVNRGISYMHLKLYDLALLDFESALGLEPENITSLVNIAHIFTLEKDVLLACRFLEKAVVMGLDDLSLLLEEPDFKPLVFSGCLEAVEKRMTGR
jgi:tetratricopeptide (TPR) repeat protein